jgi:membrane-associated phospholipid phosphatase
MQKKRSFTPPRLTEHPAPGQQNSVGHDARMPRMILSRRESSFAFLAGKPMPQLERKPNFMRATVTALLAAFVFSAIVTAFRYDNWTRAHVVASHGKGWKKSSDARMWGAVSRYGDWPWLMLAGGAGLFVAWRARNRDWQRILVTAMVASTFSGIVANGMRLTTGRARPNAGVPEGWYGLVHDGRLTIGNPKFNSFPSGHTATAVGFAGVILFARPLPGVFALLAALAIAAARIVLGAHHLSDVTVAALLAIFIAWICWREARRHGDAIAAWFARKFRRQ